MQPYEKDLSNYPPNTDKEAWFRKPSWNGDYGTNGYREYFGDISHLDAAFGRILGELEKNGLADNTVVIFTSDHGDMAGSQGLFGKGVMYDESVRVPLIIRVPQYKNHRVSNPVCTMDLFATLIDMTEVMYRRNSTANLYAGTARSKD